MIQYILYFLILQLLLLVPSYFFYKSIFRKTVKRFARTYAAICTILTPIVLTCLFFFIGIAFVEPSIRSKKFNTNDWNANVENRYKMVNDIINSKMLLGKSKEEVMDLLGTKYETGPCGNFCMGYSTYEPNQGFSIDHDVLEIDFDDKNRVDRVYINAW